MSSDQIRVGSAGRPLSAGAIALMLLLCVSWGFNQVAVKLAIHDIPIATRANGFGGLDTELVIGSPVAVKPTWAFRRSDNAATFARSSATCAA